MKRIVASAVMMLSLSVFSPSFGQMAKGDNEPRTYTAGMHVVRSIELDTKVKLEYVEQGDPNGLPVIFLHGITDSWHSFESVLHNLPLNIHAFAISQRGHGNSERPEKGYRANDFANDIAAFIRQKNLGSAVVVGHSMGGAVVQQFTLLHPKLAKGLVIIGSDADFKDNAGISEFYQEVMKMEGAISKEFMDYFQKATLTKAIDSAYYEKLVMEGTKVPVRVFQAALTGLLDYGVTNELKNIKTPTLIFWGDKDAFCFRADQEALRKGIRNSRLLIYENTGHALHWEQPERFVSDLVEFLKTVK